MSPTFASSQETLCSLRFANQVSQIELGKAQKHVQIIQQNQVPIPVAISATTSSFSLEKCSDSIGISNPTPLKAAAFSRRSSLAAGGAVPIRIPGSSSHAMSMFASVSSLAKENQMIQQPAPSVEPTVNSKARTVDTKRHFSSTVSQTSSSMTGKDEKVFQQMMLKKAKPSASSSSYEKASLQSSKSSSTWR